MSEYSVERQSDGWPVGVDEATKELLSRECAALLTEKGALHINDVLSIVKARTARRDGLRWAPSALWDHQYATIERACIAAGANRVWRME